MRQRQRATVNRRVVLAARPRGIADDRRTSVSTKPTFLTPDEGQVLLRTLYLSLDPYMRQLMDEIGPVYAPSVRLGEPMVGGTVNRVVASRHPRFRAWRSGARQRRLAGLRAVGWPGSASRSAR